MVVAPHPDDEVLGCGGVISLLAERGVPVRIIILTDGRTSHAHLMDPDRLVQIRREEALRAACSLGLSESSVAFGNFPDGQLVSHLDEAVNWLHVQLQEFQPSQVFVPHARDGQRDHEAAFGVAAEALSRSPGERRLYEYPVWLWYRWPWVPAGKGGSLRSRLSGVADAIRIMQGCRYIVDVAAVRERKMHALESYRSQMERANGDPRWPVLADVSDGDFLARLTGSTEVFRQSVVRGAS